MGYRNDHCPDMKHEEQKHVHELQGSVKIAEPMEEPHNHRFCTVTGEAIPCDDNEHVHEVMFRTDFFEGHYHEFKGKTGPAVTIGNRHIHFIDSVTSIDDGHRHDFEAATLIENPIGKECKHEDCLCDHMHEHDHMHQHMQTDYMNMDHNHKDEHMRRNYYHR